MAASAEKTKTALGELYYGLFRSPDIELLEKLENDFCFTHQQLKQTAGWMLDCRMWQEPSFHKRLEQALNKKSYKLSNQTPNQQRTRLFQSLKGQYLAIKAGEKEYPEQKDSESLPKYRIEDKELKGNFYRTCQAYSEIGVCCNLKVLNLVDNCAMDCAYCILQNHYKEAVIKIPYNLKEKLAELEIPSGERWRVGTGEHTDSLLWGNRNNLLTDLCVFAEKHPNIILELKTKSDSVGYFRDCDVPANVCCTWTLNSQTVITHEEHKTASLDRRLASARAVADRGVKVGFHLHPMIYYRGWEKEYSELIDRVIAMFHPREVLWFSLGTVTIIRDLEKQLHKAYRRSKVLQMETEVTPDNKITYACAVRKKLYRNALKALTPWKGKVVQYLCMEFHDMWQEVMGYTYTDNNGLNEAINESAFAKL
jgi:spore photoproduct lyase